MTVKLNLRPALKQVELYLEGCADRMKNMSSQEFKAKHGWKTGGSSQVKLSFKGAKQDKLQGNQRQLSQKVAYVGKESIQHNMLTEVNKHLRREAKLDIKRVKRDVRSDDKDDGEKKLADSAKIKWGFRVKISDRVRVSLQRLPHKIQYRDPKKWQRHPSRLSHYNWRYWTRGKASDSIHKGAHWRFKRYAVTSITEVAGKKRAGRKGSGKYAGIGFEPIGHKKGSGVSLSKYSFFKRESYPAHKEGAGDSVTRQLRYPIYTEIMKKSNLKKKITGSTMKDMANVVESDRTQAVKDMQVQAKNVKSKITSTLK